MRYGLSGGKVVGYDPAVGEWRPVDTTGSMLDVLAAAPAAPPPGGVCAEPEGLPFTPESLRAFALWEAHMIGGARGMVRRFGSPALKTVMTGFERLTGRTFPPLRPKANYERYPQFYVGSHRSIVPDGAPIRWPGFTDVLDFELEIGVVLAREVCDCTPEQGLAAIGGFVVVNDWSARDTQWSDTMKGAFGGVVKAKTFAGAMSRVVVTADEVLPHWNDLRGRVSVNGEIWCEGSTRGAKYSLGEAIAYAAMGETLYPGDLLSTGTLPGCCGLEMGRFIEPGDTVRLEIDRIGSVTNIVSSRKA